MKNFPILLICIGVILLIISIKQFFKMYRFNVQQKLSGRQMILAVSNIICSLIFIGGAIVWLSMIYQQLTH